MSKDAKAIVKQFKDRQSEIRDGLPDVMKHFSGVLQSALKDGALSHKVKELVTLGIVIALHVANCLKAGATREEILEVCGVTIAMGGGPSYTYAAFVLECIDAAQEKA